MPTLFRCFALRVTMNPRGNEHNPPHVHAYYKEDMAVIDVKTCQVTEGYIPPAQIGIAKRFIDNCIWLAGCYSYIPCYVDYQFCFYE